MKSSNAISITIFLFLSLSSLLSAQSPKCHPKDQIAIDKIKAAFGVNTTGDCCSWFPVVCDSVSPYRVIQFEVFNSDVISGQIPAAIGDLSFLKVLAFNNVSKLTGNIPSSIAKLSKLKSLSITKTGVSGPIPRFPQPLENLGTFILPSNALTGSIPPEISSFPILEQIVLGSNKLTGIIPESFGDLPQSMFYVSLSNNHLTGAIPKSLANVNLIYLDLSRNRFTGDASFLFGRNKQTVYLYLYKNNFTFDLSNVEYPSELEAFDISHNNIYGSLSQQLTQFNFTKFHVSFNKLCGKIPQGGSLQKFGVHSYYHNQCLCGAPLPGCK